MFSDGECVAGGCVQGTTSSSGASSSSSGAPCVPDAGCAVSWATDIFTGIMDTPSGCTSAGTCHGAMPNTTGLTLAPGDHHGAYVALTTYTLASTPGPALPYIVPCDPMASGFPCNMAVATGSTNTFGTCGTPMPLGGTLTTAQVTQIADWITCGAPEN
jgi:hypothetical protein